MWNDTELLNYKIILYKTIMKILLANPRGFCAGVDRAIEVVELALKKHGAPVYVRHEIVHNKYVVEDLRSKGAIFVKEVDEIPAGGITIFSAHGVSEKVEDSAKLRNLPIIDATCPLVTKVHNEAKRYEAAGHEIILIGHKGHPEVEGTSGRVAEVLLVEKAEDVANLQVKDPDNLSYVTQTTLSVDDTKIIINALKKRFPTIQGPDTRDICYATQNRQNSVRELAKQVDVLLVIGAQNSSNSNRLRDLGEELGVTSYLINGADEIEQAWLKKKLPYGGEVGGGFEKFRPANSHLVERAIEMRKNPTQPELLLWNRIKSGQLGGVKFRHQEPILEYVVDFISYENNMIIEVDGDTHSPQQKHDDKRSESFKNIGFNVIRFTNDEVINNIDGVLEVISNNMISQSLALSSRDGGVFVIGVTAGASAPEILVQNVINRLRELGANDVQEFEGKKENIKFKLPEQVQGMV
jgi:4-hydroxy-3-methylbut-2-enyl diphosphate reductase